jgi:PAS domain S-box-containing protein
MASLPHSFEEPEDVQDIRLVVDTIPTLAWSARPDGSAEFFNQRWLDYTGLSAEQALGSEWQAAIHPDDLPRILETFREALHSVKPYEVEGRFRRFDGEFHADGSPITESVYTHVISEDGKRVAGQLGTAVWGVLDACWTEKNEATPSTVTKSLGTLPAL